MATAQRVDPYRNFNFLVEIDGITQAGFSECTGFELSTDPIEYREGGENTTVRKLPGMTKYGNITLKWGLTDSKELYDWYRQIVTGKIQRKSGSIVVLDLEGKEKTRWNFKDAWPTKYNPADLNAKSNEIAIETIELACESLERA
jgi:phage tail-like protein